ncbi:MAG: hypothetical protein M1826_001506 [Phylliscum demangeonii]|nr:MAG: hypothetical protein M1826_001506 [Phylliscum demangeonii]
MKRPQQRVVKDKDVVLVDHGSYALDWQAEQALQRARSWSDHMNYLLAPYETKRPHFNKVSLRLWKELPEHIVDRYRLDCKDISVFSRIWLKLRVLERQRSWADIVLWFMRHRPQHALEILEATYQHPFPSLRQMSDCLHFLACHFLREAPEIDEGSVGRLLSLLYRVLERHNQWSKETRLVSQRGQRAHVGVRLHQRLCHLLFKSTNSVQTLQLYEALIAADVHFHRHTHLHIIDALGRHGHFPQAVRMVRSLLEWPDFFIHPRFQEMVSRLLVQAGALNDPDSEEDIDDETRMLSTVILEQLLLLGIIPNLVIYNVCIRNVFLSHRCGIDVGSGQGTAWAMYETMKQDGLEPDKFTFSIMLNGAKHARNWSMINDLMTEMRESEVSIDDHIVVDLLDITNIFVHTNYHRPAFHDMLARFQEFYSVRVLSRLGVLRRGTNRERDGEEEDDGPASTAVTRPDPPPYAVNLMMRVYLYGGHSVSTLVYLYSRYRTEVAAADALLADQNPNPAAGVEAGAEAGAGASWVPPSLPGPLISQVRIINAFLTAFARSRHSLVYCTGILEDMLRAPPAAATLFPRPEAYTWAIVMRGYMHHAQPAAAEMVMELMAEHGPRPTRRPWNILLSGYAHLQDVEAVLGVVGRMRDAGFLWNRWTLKALAVLSDQDTLRKGLETRGWRDVQLKGEVGVEAEAGEEEEEEEGGEGKGSRLAGDFFY